PRPGLEGFRATGSFGPGLHGEWVVLVEPEADYLVRYARFTADGESHPGITIQTVGVVRADSLTLAKQGTFTYIYDRRGSYEASVTIGALSSQTDAQLIETVRGRVTGNLPAGAETIDFRKAEPERSFERQ